MQRSSGHLAVLRARQVAAVLPEVVCSAACMAACMWLLRSATCEGLSQSVRGASGVQHGRPIRAPWYRHGPRAVHGAAPAHALGRRVPADQCSVPHQVEIWLTVL